MRSLIWQTVFALVLSAGLFYFFGLGFGMRPDGNDYPTFMAISKSVDFKAPQDIPPMYESRVVACLLSGMWFDFWSPDQHNWLEGRLCFAGYQTIWVLLLFLVLIRSLKNAWLPMAGVTAGLLGNSIATWPPYFMPWDMPAMLFFTGAYLCYRKKMWLPLLVTVFVGAFIKETVLLSSLLIFGAPWKLPQKFTAILGVILLAVLINQSLLPDDNAPAWYFSVTGWLHQFKLTSFLKLWPIIFANAGGLVILLLCLTKLNDWPLRLVVSAFIVGQCLNNIGYGVYGEFRVWCELLPLGWILFGDLKNLSAAKTPKSPQTSCHKLATS